MSQSGSGQLAVRRFYEAEAAYMASDQPDFAPVAATLDADCLLCEPASLPYGGEWRGRDGVERWLRMFRETWSSLEVRDSKLFGDGEIVFGQSHVYAKSRAAGRTADWPLLQSFRIRSGAVLELRPFHWDTAAILSASA